MEMQEIWKPVNGYECLYSVSNKGFIKNSIGNILKPHADKDGYLKVKLSKCNKQKSISVHRVVALNFLPNPHNYNIINHIIPDKTLNRVDNLEWCSQAHNVTHSLILNLRDSPKGEKHHRALLTAENVIQIRNDGKYDEYKVIGNKWGVSASCISDILKRKNWKHI